jgi:thiol-disulfide isomerase/thioredoxin
MPLHKNVCALFLALAASCLNASPVQVGDSFPELSALNLSGSLPQELRGKVVLVDFWASWCAPCKLSFPVLNDLQQTYASKDLVILGVNVDEAPKAMESFLKKTPAKFPVVRDSRQELVSKLDVGTMPTSFLIDRSGVVRFIHSGFHGDKTRAEYVREIEQLLKQQP